MSDKDRDKVARILCKTALLGRTTMKRLAYTMGVAASLANEIGMSFRTIKKEK